MKVMGRSESCAGRSGTRSLIPGFLPGLRCALGRFWVVADPPLPGLLIRDCMPGALAVHGDSRMSLRIACPEFELAERNAATELTQLCVRQLPLGHEYAFPMLLSSSTLR